MSSIDKQALRKLLDRVIANSGMTWYSEEQLGSEDCFDFPEVDAGLIAALGPKDVLALLDELEAEQRISSTWRKTAESNSEKLEAADKRIAELEASHNNLREAMAGIHNTITGGGAYTPLAAILNASKRAYEESAAAAGKGDAA
ncbi:TPA: ead/Ea22-like family protein [Escherichia coli]|nr:ead/Ea22-like family protein [Escherichia coli]